MGATTDQVKGTVKEKVGDATGDEDMQTEGRLDLIKGDLKKIADDGVALIEHALGTKTIP